MPCRPRPEAEEEPQRCDTAQRLRTIERWLLTYQGQLYHGRVIERLVSRADGLVELHVLAAPGEEHAPEGESR